MATEKQAKAPSKHPFIAHMKIGDTFEGTYYAEQAYVKQTVQKKDYTDLLLRDRSGARPVKFWGVIPGLESGNFVHVEARADEYLGNLSMVASKVEVVSEPAAMDDYIAVFDNRGELEAKFSHIVLAVHDMEEAQKDADGKFDKTCSMLLDEVFNFNGAFYPKFIEFPASSLPFYGRCGGLMANTVRVGEGTLAMGKHHELSPRELILTTTSALLFRIGAVDAFVFKNCMPEMNKRGILLGVPNLTMARLYAAIRKVSAEAKTAGTPVSQDAFLRILHAVSTSDELSVKPMTKEAITLASANKADADAVQAFDFIANDLNADDEFTAYDPKAGRRYFKG